MSQKNSDRLQQAGATLALLAVAGLFAYPFLWMALSSLKSNLEVFTPGQLFPQNFGLEAWSIYADLWQDKWDLPFGRVFLNSLLVALVQACGAVAVTAAAGFAFACYQFPGKPFWFAVALLSILVPRQVLALPLFGWLATLGLNDHLLGVILPGIASGIGLVFFTLVFREVPREYLDLARLEGASEFRTFLTVLPLVSSFLLTYGMIHFILAWHEHLLPLLVLSSPNNLTLPIALAKFNDSSYHVPKALLMAASTLTALPTFVLFALLYRRFKSSLSELLIQ